MVTGDNRVHDKGSPSGFDPSLADEDEINGATPTPRVFECPRCGEHIAIDSAVSGGSTEVGEFRRSGSWCVPLGVEVSQNYGGGVGRERRQEGQKRSEEQLSLGGVLGGRRVRANEYERRRTESGKDSARQYLHDFSYNDVGAKNKGDPTSCSGFGSGLDDHVVTQLEG
jgi:hypothetical protein